MRALELPPRLRLIAGWVPEGAYLADVGTDHGYLPDVAAASGKDPGSSGQRSAARPVGAGQGDRIALRYGQH